MTFEAKAIPPVESNTAFSPAWSAVDNSNKDNQGNAYFGTAAGSKSDGGGSEGGLTRGNQITMREMDNTKAGDMPSTKDAGNDPKMVNHEMLHTMGNDDHPGGRMEYQSTGEDMRDVSKGDVQQTIDYALKNDGKERGATSMGRKATVTQSGNGNIKGAKSVQVTSVEKTATTPPDPPVPSTPTK